MIRGKMTLKFVCFTVGQPSTSTGVTSDKGKEWQMELLMEKLRSKSSTLKPLVETAKNMRMAMLVREISSCVSQVSA